MMGEGERTRLHDFCAACRVIWPGCKFSSGVRPMGWTYIVWVQCSRGGARRLFGVFRTKEPFTSEIAAIVKEWNSGH